MLVCCCLKVSTVRADREVVGIVKLLFTKTCNGNEVTPLGTLCSHVLLEAVSNLLLSVGKGAYKCIEVSNRENVSRVGYLLTLVSIGGNSDTITVNMIKCFGIFTELIESHDVGNGDFYNVPTEVERLYLVFPSPNFLLGIGLFRKLHNFLRVEGKLCLSTSESVIDSNTTLTESLKGICRSHLLPEEEVRYRACVTGITKLLKVFNGVFSCIINVLIHSVIVEAVELLYVLLQSTHDMGEFLELLARHLVYDKFSTCLLHKSICRVNEVLKILHETYGKVSIT